MTDSRETQKPKNHKALGAYYTDAQIAEFLVWWAIRSSTDTVCDPAFGGGVFLRAASKRLRDLGGDPGLQVFGVEVDPAVHREISAKLEEDGVAAESLLERDFFATLWSSNSIMPNDGTGARTPS